MNLSDFLQQGEAEDVEGSQPEHSELLLPCCLGLCGRLVRKISCRAETDGSRAETQQTQVGPSTQVDL